MVNLLARIKTMFHDRRRVGATVGVERRKVTMKDAEAMLQNSIDRLDRTVRLKREDLFKHK